MAQNSLLPEERARIKIDRQLTNAGWDIVSRDEYVPRSASAVKEALMQGNTESDYLLFVDDKAIAVVEAKREENPKKTLSAVTYKFRRRIMLVTHRTGTAYGSRIKFLWYTLQTAIRFTLRICFNRTVTTLS